ncbi:hypothetical protein Barb4_05459 [Bacteroidales bacterium Barb4]|nr:hypothetical protein Barb4_05459 [Bacteroidales bacterium Barb4]
MRNENGFRVTPSKGLRQSISSHLLVIFQLTKRRCSAGLAVSSTIRS